MECWLARFRPDVPCEGRLIRAHLLPKQLLRREGLSRCMWDSAVWVPACGGPTGVGGHHGMLDHSRTLKVPRSEIPRELEDFCAEMGLRWALEREYGPLLSDVEDVGDLREERWEP